MRALIVDDHEADVSMVAAALTGLYPDDLELTQATRLSYAKQLLRENRYDLVVLDLSYPDSMADETWYAIKPLIHDAQVIIHSAFIDRRLMLHLIHAGVQHFVDKPDPVLADTLMIRSALEREVLKSLAIQRTAAVEPIGAEVRDRLVDLEVQVKGLEKMIYRGNGESLLTQVKLMAGALAEARADIGEMKPQINALAQLRMTRWTSLMLGIVAILGSIVSPWVLSKWGKP